MTYKTTVEHNEIINVPEPMTEARAREILGDSIRTDGKGWIANEARDIFVTCHSGGIDVSMQSFMTVDELEAIAWWMRNKT
jgi:hypothetical protein